MYSLTYFIADLLIAFAIFTTFGPAIDGYCMLDLMLGSKIMAEHSFRSPILTAVFCFQLMAMIMVFVFLAMIRKRKSKFSICLILNIFKSLPNIINIGLIGFIFATSPILPSSSYGLIIFIIMISLAQLLILIGTCIDIYALCDGIAESISLLTKNKVLQLSQLERKDIFDNLKKSGLIDEDKYRNHVYDIGLSQLQIELNKMQDKEIE